MNVIEEKSPQLSLPLEAPGSLEKDRRAEVPSVSELTRRIRGHLESAFLNVWVRGEISNFRKPVSGHAYFILKDEKAQMRAVMFRGKLSQYKFQIQDGMEVIVHGAVSVYEARGEYQIICDAIEPVGVGALQLAFEQLKTKLHKEGLFDKAHKKALPFLPARIGIVTSATGAAVKDILKVLSRRFKEREVLILPASVQGEKAAGEICQSIEMAEKWNLTHPDRKIDVLIVGRGGGSLEDMWCFNEEVVARKIFSCPIPIISAVGHEIDFTIADFVADLRAPTPSAAAEMVIPRKEDLVYQVAQQQRRMLTHLKRALQQARLHVGHLSQRLTDPRERIRRLKESFLLMEQRFFSQMSALIKIYRKRLESYAQLLHSLSPLQVIGRGYTITTSEKGRVIRSTKDAQVGTLLEHRVCDGTIVSKVERLHRTEVVS